MKQFHIISILILLTSLLYSQSSDEILRLEAQRYMEDGRFGEAIDLLNRYISANPQNSIGYNLRGLCYENRGQYELSVNDYKSALKLEPKNPDYQENLERNTAVWEKHLHNKIIGYNREIALDPNRAINYLEMGKCYKNLGQWEEAESWYDEYLIREEASADEMLRYSEILAKNNHLKKGEPLLKNYTEKYPDDHRVWSRYGYYSMWLGNKLEAIKAFETSLEIKPYFKEALDGYDMVRGKGYVFTVNEPFASYNYGLPVQTSSGDYPIDRYYRKLKSDPDDIYTRKLLINELMDKNRYEEAYEQIKILETTESESNDFKELKAEVLSKREKYNKDKINSLKTKLEQQPNDRKTLLELADFYSYNNQYDEALKILGRYLVYNPDDDEVRYRYAKIHAWNGNLDVAKSEMKKLLSDDPRNLDYNLFDGQLSAWNNTDLEKGEESLQYVLSYQPDNIPALTSLALINFQQNELEDAEYYISKLRKVDPNNPEISNLLASINNQKLLNEEAELYLILESARQMVTEENCTEAVRLFKEYLENEKANKNVRKELADAYLCLEDYSNALRLYSELVKDDPDNFDLQKQRAKIYLWSGDSKTALHEFQKLSLLNPEDEEVKLFLADSYFAEKQYSSARVIYEDMLSESPESETLQMRMRWLGSEGSSETFGSDFPTYMMLTPEAYYFSDNFDFLYSTYGLRYEFGLNNMIAIGVSGYGGWLGSDSLTESISMLKGTGYLRFNKYLSASLTFGTTMFNNYDNSFLTEIRFVAEDRKKYSFSANYYSMDAAQLLYSPFLVPVRLRANMVLLQGYYITKSAWKFSGEYAFLDISDDNNGNRLQLRLGKYFDKEFIAGYEYYYYDVKNETQFYWSPTNYETHSIWADWTIEESKTVNVLIGGKVGYIPSDEFILREIYGMVVYRITGNFSLQGRASFSTNVQSGRGYSSTSFNIAAFWSF